MSLSPCAASLHCNPPSTRLLLTLLQPPPPPDRHTNTTTFKSWQSPSYSIDHLLLCIPSIHCRVYNRQTLHSDLSHLNPLQIARYNYFLKIHFTIIAHPRLGIPRNIFLSRNLCRIKFLHSISRSVPSRSYNCRIVLKPLRNTIKRIVCA
jgi:hypothetical protein